MRIISWHRECVQLSWTQLSKLVKNGRRKTLFVWFFSTVLLLVKSLRGADMDGARSRIFDIQHFAPTVRPDLGTSIVKLC